MRHLATLALGALIALAAAGSSDSQVSENPEVRRCDSGLVRSLNACHNMHDIGSTNWHKCLDYSTSMHQICVREALENMDTVGG